MLRFLGAGDEGRQLRSPADHANRLSQDALEDWCHERSPKTPDRRPTRNAGALTTRQRVGDDESSWRCSWLDVT